MHEALMAHCARRGVGFLLERLRPGRASICWRNSGGALQDSIGRDHQSAVSAPHRQLRQAGLILSSGHGDARRKSRRRSRCSEGAGTARRAHHRAPLQYRVSDADGRCESARHAHDPRQPSASRSGIPITPLGIEVAIAAVALGATVIEKHFTLDRHSAGAGSQGEPGARRARGHGRARSATSSGPWATGSSGRAQARRGTCRSRANRWSPRAPYRAGETFSADESRRQATRHRRVADALGRGHRTHGAPRFRGG